MKLKLLLFSGESKRRKRQPVTRNLMETWFWILGWFLSILTMAGNGFVIFLLCRKRRLRTKTNAFVVSLAVADLFVGMLAVPSRFFCEMTSKCSFRGPLREGLFVVFVRVFVVYASGANLCSLVLERYIAVVKPLKYLTFMKRRRVIQMVSISWGIPFTFTVIVSSLRFNDKKIALDLVDLVNGWLYMFFEVILCIVLIFCLAHMLLVVYKQRRKDRIVAKQLQFNQRVSQNSGKICSQNDGNCHRCVSSVLRNIYALQFRLNV